MICCLQELHALRIVYRDLKPENVIVDSTGHCKLVDFGFSIRLKEKCKAYTNCGTADYVAPEVLKEIGTSFEADVWSLGVLFHEICCGERPFHHDDPQ